MFEMFLLKICIMISVLGLFHELNANLLNPGQSENEFYSFKSLAEQTTIVEPVFLQNVKCFIVKRKEKRKAHSVLIFIKIVFFPTSEHLFFFFLL